MKARYIVSKFGENKEAAFHLAQVDLNAKLGTPPSELVELPHPVRFGPYKFASRLMESIVTGKTVHGISPKHAELIKDATAALEKGWAVGFKLHGGAQAVVRGTQGTQRLKGEAYAFFGFMEVDSEAKVALGSQMVDEAVASLDVLTNPSPEEAAKMETLEATAPKAEKLTKKVKAEKVTSEVRVAAEAAPTPETVAFKEPESSEPQVDWSGISA